MVTVWRPGPQQWTMFEPGIWPDESTLQTLLAENPDMLGSALGGRWLLLKREMGVSDGDQSPRWAVDHLFVDDEGIPTLIEVKRSSDSRIRREVIGQLLEYAAYATAYWSVELLEKAWRQQAGERAEILWNTFRAGDGVRSGDFWPLVQENLDRGRLRLGWVADEIPPELATVIRWLARQWSPSDVFALAIRPYRAGEEQLVTLENLSLDRPAARSGIRQRTFGLSAKDWIREQIRQNGVVRLEDGIAAGYKETTLKTALSDLKNPTYCGPAGPLVLVRDADSLYRPEGGGDQHA